MIFTGDNYFLNNIYIWTRIYISNREIFNFNYTELNVIHLRFGIGYESSDQEIQITKTHSASTVY